VDFKILFIGTKYHNLNFMEQLYDETLRSQIHNNKGRYKKILHRLDRYLGWMRPCSLYKSKFLIVLE
jgi:hypothetical protein